jgi:hypothetical protein
VPERRQINHMLQAGCSDLIKHQLLNHVCHSSTSPSAAAVGKLRAVIGRPVGKGRNGLSTPTLRDQAGDIRSAVQIPYRKIFPDGIEDFSVRTNNGKS